eukprot:TRINITY_DN2931_c0_g1_i1.p1 TRINITY_DN2931_c0_g1~~TRINITY_DN2931_c0_g1_i1.p1  ORF type:complete len:120 (+),score=14.35 TRINITY_DN2931_c0_g1_i1:62-421(+)
MIVHSSRLKQLQDYEKECRFMMTGMKVNRPEPPQHIKEVWTLMLELRQRCNAVLTTVDLRKAYCDRVNARCDWLLANVRPWQKGGIDGGESGGDSDDDMFIEDLSAKAMLTNAIVRPLV